MSAVTLVLFFLIAITPALLFVDGPLCLGAWSAVLSVGLAVVARTIRPSEAARLTTLARPVAVVASIPAIVMLVQVLPVPDFFPTNNPIWQSVATALGRPILGSISIDIGSTLLSLCRYLAWSGVGVLSIAVAIERQRAEKILFAATLASIAMAALVIANDVGVFNVFKNEPAASARIAALDGAALGLILSAACAERAYELFQERTQSLAKMLRNIVLSTVGFATCAVAIALGDNNNVLFAGAAGVAALLGIVLVRRLGLGLWGALAFAVVTCAIGLGIVAGHLRQGASDPTVDFAAESSSKAITERMLADSPWLGTGAGTYQILVPIYRLGFESANPEPPTAAAELAVEVGRPLLWFGILGGIAMLISLVRGAVGRGRDSFYPAAGAAALVVLLVTAFGNAGMFGSALQIVSGAVLGLAFAQRRSRTVYHT